MNTNIKFKVIFYFLIIISTSLQAQFQNNTRGIYINNFKEIIGNQTAEDEMLSFVQNEGFNYLLLYNLYHIQTQMFDITSEDTATPLIEFIEKAKTQYGIIEVGGVGEKFASFDKMTLYNEVVNQNPNQKIDVFHMEFEFWNKSLAKGYYCDTYLEKNGYPCTKAGAFDFYFDELLQLEDLSNQIGIKSETYIGNPKRSECDLIGKVVDRALVHYYRKSDVYNDGNSIYNFKKYRVKKLAPNNGTLNIIPVFSSRSYHMGPWLLENSQEQAIETWWFGQNGFDSQSGNWKNHINVEGYQWYRYTDYKYYVENSAFDDLENARQGEEKQDNLIGETKISVFPNPANDWISFSKADDLNRKIQIFDFTGKIVWEGNLATDLNLEVGDWQKGMYILKSPKSSYKFILQ